MSCKGMPFAAVAILVASCAPISNNEGGIRPLKPMAGSSYTLQDCPECPPLVVVEGNDKFLQGPSAQEQAILRAAGIPTSDRQKTTTVRSFAVSQTEITLRQFNEFLSATNYPAAQGDGCTAYAREFPYITSRPRPELSFRNPGFEQTELSPVVCVTITDARVYAQWLSDRTGFFYRLPSEAEWELLARATYADIGDAPTDPDTSNICRYENIADESVSRRLYLHSRFGCDDGYGDETAPVGHYLANRFGVFDVIGNVGEYVGDCGEDLELPSERIRQGSLDHPCSHYIIKGASFITGYPGTIPSAKVVSKSDQRVVALGFRLVRELVR